METTCRIFAAIVSTDLYNTPGKLYVLMQRIVLDYTPKRVLASNRMVIHWYKLLGKHASDFFAVEGQ